MKKLLAYVLLTIFSIPGFAEVPIDGLYQLDVPDNTSTYFIIEQGALKDGSGFLFDPVCAGQLQSPALITDLSAFFAGYAGTRVIDRGDGQYLFTQKSEPAAEKNQHAGKKILNTVYAELDFNSVTEGTFTIRAASTFFTDTGTSTCLATNAYELNRLKS